MAIHAYMSDYLDHAMETLGDMLDFGVNTCKIEASEIMRHFCETDIGELFADGNPKYIAGMNGCELLRSVWKRAGLSEIEEDDVMYMDKSPEYWAGWVLAYYQWKTCRSFQDILADTCIDDLIEMYYPLHEADISKVVEVLNSRQKG